MSPALARLATEAATIGRLFFCDLRVATGSADAEPALAHALALAERLLGPVASMERRASATHVLLQALHRDGAVAHIACRTGARDALAIEVDGDAGSLRLEESGRLVRHGAAAAVVLIDPAAADPGTLAAQRPFAHAPP